jgi:glycosyltransferase involved in cell wall biosynthesis
VRIGLDARSVFSPRPRGTGRNLLDAYCLIPTLRPDWEFVLYHQREVASVGGDPARPTDAERVAADRSPFSLPNVRTRRIDIPGDRLDLWFQARLPAAAWRDAVDLLHLPANAAPATCAVPLVVTIHDLIPLTVAGEATARQRRAFQRGIVRAVRNAAQIITPSNATRDELQRMFAVDPGRITVIPWAPDRGILRTLGTEGLTDGRSAEAALAVETERIRQRYGLDDAWLLNFSGSSPRKNALRVIDAFARVAPGIRRAVPLVLVGCEPPAFRAALETQAAQHHVRSDCRLLGFVPQEDLAGLLAGARGLLMPSLCEGFGLPILDAFACGTPVLTSNCSSMPEVAGAAALYCDPHDAASIADGIAGLLDPGVAQRLICAGFRRLRHYSWEQTARLMCAVYERCLLESQRLVKKGSSGAVKPRAASVAEASGE